MNSEINKPDELTEHLIISVAYGDCTFAERVKLWFLLKKSPGLKTLFEEYKTTADKVKNLSVTEYENASFLNEFVKPKINLFDDSPVEKTASLFIRKPFAFSSAVVLTVAAITLGIIFNKPLNSPQYSEEEIARANMQVKESLALIGTVLNKTQNTIEEEIFSKRVAKPINKGINTVNNLFSNGGKNEK